MYQPLPLPFKPDVDSLARHVDSEHQRIAQAASDPVDYVQFNVLAVAMKKPRDGMVAYGAAGVFGVAAGFYGREAGAWVKL